MPLTGQAKTDYQRRYMRQRRADEALLRDFAKLLGLKPKRSKKRPARGR